MESYNFGKEKVITIKALARKLEAEPLGRLCIMNFVDGVSNGVFDRDVVKRFLTEWARATASMHSLGSILQEIRNVRERDLDVFGAGLGIELNCRSSDVWTVAVYRHVKTMLRDDTLSGGLSGAETATKKFDRSTDSTERNRIETYLLGLGERNVFFKPKGIKDSDHKLIWISSSVPGEVLSGGICHASRCRSKADVARNSLGLVHYLPGSPPPILVALRINKSELPRLTRPTAIDAENHSRFRGAFGDLRKNASGWGRTIHLETLSDQIGKLGAPEAVCQNFRPKDAKLRFLGYLRTDAGTGSAEDARFVRACERRRAIPRASGLSRLGERFVALC